VKRDERLPPLLAAFLGAESDAADAPRTGGARFLRFPGTGGGWVLLDAANPAVFRAGTALLPRGRFVTRLATRVVGASARVGLHGRFARARVAAARVVDPAERFPGLPRGLACNAASGVPGRDQKTIVQLVSPNGRVLAFAKVADSLAARALVRREHDALAQLAHQPSRLLLVAAQQHVRRERAVQRGALRVGLQHGAARVQPPERLVHHRARNAGLLADLVAGGRVLAQQRRVDRGLVLCEADRRQGCQDIHVCSCWPVAATFVAATGQKTNPWRDEVPPNHPFQTGSQNQCSTKGMRKW